MVKYLNNGMGTFSLVCIVKDDLFTLGYSICETSVLKVLKERESCGQVEAAQCSEMLQSP